MSDFLGMRPMSCFLYYNTLFFFILNSENSKNSVNSDSKKGKTTSHHPISLSTTIISNTDQITMQHQLHHHQVKDERMCNAKNKKRRAKAGFSPTLPGIASFAPLTTHRPSPLACDGNAEL